MSLLFHLGESSCLGDALRLGDGCGALCLGGVGVNWGSQARKLVGESKGAFLQGGVDGAAVLRDKCGGGVDRSLVRCCSMLKYSITVVSLNVPNSHCQVLGITNL